MAIYKRDIANINLETGNIHRTFLNHSIGYMDQKADHFGIRVFRNGEPVDLTGVSVQGVFMPPQGSPIAITGSTYTIVSGNTAEVILPQVCYNYEGNFTLAIKLVDATNAVTGTMRIVDGMVDNTHASGTVAPTGSVPTYQEVLSVYDSMVDALEDYQDVVDEQNAKIENIEETIGGLIVERRYSTTDSGKYGLYTGYYKSADGTTASSAKYKRTAKISAFSGKPVKIKIGSDFEFAVLFWDSNDTYEASKYTDYHSDENGYVFFVEQGDQIGINIRKKDKSSISSDDEAEIKDTLETYTYFIPERVNDIETNYIPLGYTKATTISATEESPDDLDNYTTVGTYKVVDLANANHIAHMPYPIRGRLIVMTLAASATLSQVYITSAATKTNIYVRNYYSGAWNNWININPTYDTQPTENSIAPVTSGGIYNAEKVLNDKIEAVDEAVEEIIDSLENPIDFDWANLITTAYPYGWRTGYYDAETGEIKSSNFYIRVAKKIVFAPSVEKIKATAPEGYAIAVSEYDETDAFVQRYGSMDSTGETATTEVTVNVTKGYIYLLSVGKFTDNNAGDYLTEAFVSTIKLVMYDSEVQKRISNVAPWCSAIGTAPTYRIPVFAPLGTTLVEDITMTDGAKANITQGMCSDGVRYLYWNVAPMGDDLGRNVMQRIRKWDTWTNAPVALSEPGDWGHCEDTCFVPYWCPGFDNGNVDRIYATDFDYSTGTPTGRYIHVIDANTLEYITSFPTDTLAQGEWNGVAHITFNQERGLFCMKGGTTIDDDPNYWVFLVFDMNGNLLRGARVHKSGTGIGIDSDENYIYASRTTSSYPNQIPCYVIDWDLNPIARFFIDRYEYEAEGLCHIGSDIYMSWNQEYSTNRKNTIEKTRAVFEMHQFADTPPFNWPSTDGIKLSTWTHLDIQS